MTEKQKFISFLIGAILIEALVLAVIFSKFIYGAKGLALPPF